jgi:hypothetical protein
MSNIDHLDSISNIISRIVEENQSDDFILYISNNSNPIIVYSKREIESSLKKLSSLYTSLPDIDDEIDRINEVFDRQKLFLDFTNKENTDELDFYFIMDYEKTKMYNLITRFINKLLLTNRLITGDGLATGIQVTVYLNKNAAYTQLINTNNYKELGYEFDEF